MMTSSGLAKVLEPVSIPEFVTTYFMKQPLIIAGNRVKHNWLICDDIVERFAQSATDIRAVFPKLKQARVQADEIYDMHSSGATLCFTGVERATPELADLVKDAKQSLLFSGPVTMRAYWSPPGSGFDKHFDPRNITTLQLSGAKEWYYTAVPSKYLPLGNSASPLMPADEEFLRAAEIRHIILGPGDVFYLPPGCWHWAKASDGPSLSINLALDYLGGTLAEIVSEGMLRKMVDIPALRNPLFSASAEEAVDLFTAQLRQSIAAAHEVLEQLSSNDAAIRSLISLFMK